MFAILPAIPIAKPEALLVADPKPPPKPKTDRSWDWGVFSIPEVFKKGAHTGFGAGCMRHHNVGSEAACKVQMQKQGLSDDECILRLKRWLVLGLDIDPANPEGKQLHMRNRPFSLSEGKSLLELDLSKDG